jgi:hypothetical protein
MRWATAVCASVTLNFSVLLRTRRRAEQCRYARTAANGSRRRPFAGAGAHTVKVPETLLPTHARWRCAFVGQAGVIQVDRYELQAELGATLSRSRWSDEASFCTPTGSSGRIGR